MAGLVPAIHVVGTQILQLYCHDFVKRRCKMAANIFDFGSWTTYMAEIIPAMTAMIDSVI